jgi:hypothetical protein
MNYATRLLNMTDLELAEELEYLNAAKESALNEYNTFGDADYLQIARNTAKKIKDIKHIQDARRR